MTPDESTYLHSLCHPSNATWLRLVGKEAELICAKCERVIATLIVQEITAGYFYETRRHAATELRLLPPRKP